MPPGPRETESVSAEPGGAHAQANAAEPRRSIHLGILGRTPEFTARQWRVFLIGATAGFFDNYDTALLSLALRQIQASLKIAEARLGAILSLIRLGYILSFMLTPIADVFGRRRLLLYTIVGYTLFTALSAIAPGERSFVIFQIGARAFAGAEATIALVILAEEVDAGVRGWAIGLLTALSLTGYGLAALAFGAIRIIPYGWRGLYSLALIPLAVIIPLRRTLPESRRFERESATERAGLMRPLGELARVYPRRLGMMLAVQVLRNLGSASAGAFFPKYLQEVHRWTPAGVSKLFVLGGGIGILGSVIAGRLSDRYGRRTTGAIFMLMAPLLTLWIYSAAGASVVPAWILELFFDSASWAIVNSYSAELFPTSYRSTAASAASIAGTTGGALGLFMESVLYRWTGSPWSAIRILTLLWLGAPIVLFAFFPETASAELETISPAI
ncbi:MAG TPA: MFS transporter [Candidatus Binataceae bacterium]|nr:MFS transporter [Candidatus Binataceae bacterium]